MNFRRVTETDTSILSTITLPSPSNRILPWNRTFYSYFLIILTILITSGCSKGINPAQESPPENLEEETAPTVNRIATVTKVLVGVNNNGPAGTSSLSQSHESSDFIPPETPTSRPTVTHTTTPTATSTPHPTATATPIGPCTERMPGDSLFSLVTSAYGLSRHYVPPDLVPLSDYLPLSVTLGYPTMIRKDVLPDLLLMIEDMHSVDLHPTIISGYRSYSTQQIAWEKWSEQYPERVSIISAPPGHSEHQLGTTIDFGSPELSEIVGDEDIQFHTSFYLTSEAIWLDQHAHEYGFHLSFTRDGFELSGMYYEPWHYRYLGVELATKLKNQSMTFIEYALANLPQPCIP